MMDATKENSVNSSDNNELIDMQSIFGYCFSVLKTERPVINNFPENSDEKNAQR